MSHSLPFMSLKAMSQTKVAFNCVAFFFFFEEAFFSALLMTVRKKRLLCIFLSSLDCCLYSFSVHYFIIAFFLDDDAFDHEFNVLLNLLMLFNDLRYRSEYLFATFKAKFPF